MDNYQILSLVLSGISIITSILLVRYKFYLESKKKELENLELKLKDQVQFFPVERGVNNEIFYKEFNKLITQAKRSVYVTGRGFSMDDSDESFAKKYISTIRQSLTDNKKLEFYRIQFGDKTNEAWLKEFKQLKSEFGNRLRFFMTDSPNQDIVHVATIDPEEKECCVSEIMIPNEDFLNIKRESAGSAIFINGSPQIANAIKERFSQIAKNTSVCKELSTDADFDIKIESVKNGSSPKRVKSNSFQTLKETVGFEESISVMERELVAAKQDRWSRADAAPADDFNLTIEEPVDRTKHSSPIEIIGTATNYPTDKHFWLVVKPKDSFGWWPQGSELNIDSDNRWGGMVYYAERTNQKLEIHFVVADDNSNDAFNKYILDCNETNEYVAKPLPSGAKSMKFITIMSN